MSVDQARELASRAGVSATPGPLVQVCRRPFSFLGLEQIQQLPGGDHVVPDLKLAGTGIPGHPLPVGNQRGPHRPASRLRGQPVVPRKDDQTREETLDVPFERPAQRLVEVAQVKGQLPLRSSPQAEVEHVGVATQLHRDIGVRRRGQVRGHDRRGAAVIGPR